MTFDLLDSYRLAPSCMLASHRTAIFDEQPLPSYASHTYLVVYSLLAPLLHYLMGNTTQKQLRI